MPLTNLELAQAAVAYTTKTLVYGSANKPTDPKRCRAAGHLVPPVGVLRGLIPGADTADVGTPDHDLRAHASSIITEARYIERFKMGNCGEQASVAFTYLMNRGVKDLAVFGLEIDPPYKSLNFNHCFVVLGLKNEPPPTQFLSFRQFPTGWEDAVWCDPWAGKCFEVACEWPDETLQVIFMLPNAIRALTLKIHLECWAYYAPLNPKKPFDAGVLV